MHQAKDRDADPAGITQYGYVETSPLARLSVGTIEFPKDLLGCATETRQRRRLYR